MPSERATALAWKRISPVEVDLTRSRQHEFHAGGLHAILGRPVGKDTYPAKYYYWRAQHPKPVTASSTFTYYDARENSPSRTELRLYYPTNTVTRMAGPGDLFLIEFGWTHAAKVHIVENGSPRCSSIALNLSQNDNSRLNVLRVLKPQDASEAERMNEVLQLLPDAYFEDKFVRKIEASVVVEAACQQLIASGERPTPAQIMAAVENVQSVEWPRDSWDETVSKRMTLGSYIHQEVEVLRLHSHPAERSHGLQQLRSAVQVSAAHLRASEQHLEQAFVLHVLSVLEESIGRGRLTVSQLVAEAAVLLMGPPGSAQSVVLVCMKVALHECLLTVPENVDWVLTDNFPDQGEMQQLVNANPSVKIVTVRSGRASVGLAPAIWGPDLDSFLLKYAA